MAIAAISSVRKYGFIGSPSLRWGDSVRQRCRNNADGFGKLALPALPRFAWSCVKPSCEWPRATFRRAVGGPATMALPAGPLQSTLCELAGNRLRTLLPAVRSCRNLATVTAGASRNGGGPTFQFMLPLLGKGRAMTKQQAQSQPILFIVDAA